MKVEYINPFVRSASEVLERELGWVVEQGAPFVHRSAYTPDEVTILLTVEGAVRGFALYSCSERTACRIAEALLGQEIHEFDELARSGIADLGEFLTTTAGVYLAEAGYQTTISSPTLLVGAGTLISSSEVARLVVPLTCNSGVLEVHLVLDG